MIDRIQCGDSKAFMAEMKKRKEVVEKPTSSFGIRGVPIYESSFVPKNMAVALDRNGDVVQVYSWKEVSDDE